MEMIFMGFMFYSRDFLSIGNLVKRSQPFLEIRMEKDFILLHSIGGKKLRSNFDTFRYGSLVSRDDDP